MGDESRVPDLMQALEDSLAAAQAAALRRWWATYDALCIHGPGSPDKCGHPDCVGARSIRPPMSIDPSHNASSRTSEA